MVIRRLELTVACGFWFERGKCASVSSAEGGPKLTTRDVEDTIHNEHDADIPQ